MNDFGHVVGSSARGDGACQTCNTRAALWRDGLVVDLGFLGPPGTPFMTNVAQAINNADEIDRARVLGIAIADANGVAVRNIPVPPAFHGRELVFQALD